MRARLLRRLAYVRRNRCSVLVVMLCLFILLSPLLADTPHGTTVLGVALCSILVLAVWALRARRPLVWAVAALAFLSVDALIAHRLGEHWVRPAAFAVVALFMAVVTAALLLYVLDRRPITIDKVFGAIAAYCLIAFTFASLFALAQYFNPTAFSAAASAGFTGPLDWWDMMYFSFTVLTSTGFGEITPATPAARSLVVVEQLVGVMYVAFLIARLANLYGAMRRSD